MTRAEVVTDLLQSRGAWLLTRYDDVVAVHVDPRFSSDIQKHGNVPLTNGGGPIAGCLLLTR